MAGTNFQVANPLPTLDNLGVKIPADLDAGKIAKEWFSLFSSNVENGNDAYWRDILSFTWDFRTFQGLTLKKFLVDRLVAAHATNFQLNNKYLEFQQPYPDLAWIQAMFTFETSVGLASGVFRLIPQRSGEWKAHCVFTNLEDLKGFLEKIGPLRDFAPNHGGWAEARRRSSAFETGNPTVLIVGGGQSGLELAARLKYLDIPTLVVEKNARVGDNWRNRYDALCLHDPVWYDNMPYMPFPPTWPVYTPALKLANWLEHYAEALELPVWTSSEVTSASHDASGSWQVVVSNGQGKDRIFHVKHLVFATGFGSYRGKLPIYPGMDEFKGQILHSSQHKRATDHLGKKVVVIGACTSAHDISADYYEHGVDVTMFQRSSTYVMTVKNGWRVLMDGVYSENAPPTDVADRLNASFPNHSQSFWLRGGRWRLRRPTIDRDLLDGLRKRGFRLNLGYKDAGFLLAVWESAGGYYLDVGASQMIVDGKIKLKNDSPIECFTPGGLKFENGSELPADVVVFATGVGDVRDNIRKVCGDEVADKCNPIWGLDEDGEIKGCWRDLGIPGLWYMMGNLAYCRFHSKHVALQIKAIEEGIFGSRYSIGQS
ncbi:FAD/NAD-binding domain-containing protein [Mycena sp. CBHHK59/15]|nr:FAD/NAD-binding domain-containing protein [Mycena sp. CBHHK59/15]